VAPHSFEFQSPTASIDSQGFCKINLKESFGYNCTFAEMKKRFFIIKVMNAHTPLKPISYVLIDILTLSIGPSNCDLQLKNYNTEKPIGRLSCEI